MRCHWITALLCPRAAIGLFFAVNNGPSELIVKDGKLANRVAPRGGFLEQPSAPDSPGPLRVVVGGAEQSLVLASGTAGRHVGILGPRGKDEKKCRSLDTNDLQVALALAAGGCRREDFNCVASRMLGGVPEAFARRLFVDVWISWDYWSQCNEASPSPVLRTAGSFLGRPLEVLREQPLVAAVRGFATEEECTELMSSARLEDLTVAHVGGTGGSTSTSMSRETLSTNLFVDWDKESVLSLVSTRMFDLATELLGTRVPYEGQEPLNFLHYLKGFEYRPHADGMSGTRTALPTGKRVATTLAYCEAPVRGGATVFPQGQQQLKFKPGVGDLLFFAYSPDPNSDAMHAACPVLEGNKTVLTQWHRLGVSIEEPWDRFEDWGTFHNPYAASRWQGPRYVVSREDHEEL